MTFVTVPSRPDLTPAVAGADTSRMTGRTIAGVPIPEDLQRRLNLWKGAGALVLVGLWGWFGFVKDAEVPMLQFLDIAVHEVGHRTFSPFGETTMLIMGSGSQCLFPFVVGLVFGAWKRDLIAWGIAWAWCAGSFADAARYIADATQGSGVLLGGGPGALGDWERILGPEHWDKLFLADDYARTIRGMGIVIWIAALGLVLAGIWWNWRRMLQADRTPLRDERLSRLDPLAPLSQEDMWR